jgi:hypothetical protein
MQAFELAPIGTKPLWWSLSILSLVVLMAVLALVAALLLLHLPKIEVGADGIRIGSSLFGRTIPLSQLELEGARRVDIVASPELRPKWRTMGIGLPGYKAGWFRLQNGDKALLFVTNAEDVVYVPTKDDYALMVTPADPAAFLAALNSAGR